MRTTSLILAGVAASFTVFASSSSFAAPQVVPFEQLGNKSLYPARVIAINFAGNTLQNGSPVRWNAWTVSLEPGVAHLRLDAPPEWGMSVDVKCENAVQGVAKTCTLSVSNSDVYGCNLAPNDEASATFRIDCPVSLTLDY